MSEEPAGTLVVAAAHEAREAVAGSRRPVRVRVLLGFALVRADELPADTNKIESLTSEQPRELARELKTLDADAAKALVQPCRPLTCDRMCG